MSLIHIKPSSLPLHSTVSINLMNNEHLTWTVERERGMSFDLTRERGMSFDLSALCADPEGHNRQDIIIPESVKREVKLEAGSSVDYFPFGHPSHPVLHHNHTRERQPSVHFAPPSPVLRSTMPEQSKRFYPEPPSNESSYGSGRCGPATKRQRGDRGQALESSGGLSATSPAASATARAHTRSRSAGHRAPARKPSISPPRRAPPPAPKASAGNSTSRVKSKGGLSVRRNKSSPSKSESIDTATLSAELGLVDARHRLAGPRGGKGSAVHRVGAYTLEQRAVLVTKFHSKRGRRIWRKKIKYDCRKKLADKRPRLKGRFVTQEELDGLDAETLAKVTGLVPPSDAESSTEDAEDSDSSQGDTVPTSSASRSRGASGTVAKTVTKNGVSPGGDVGENGFVAAALGTPRGGGAKCSSRKASPVTKKASAERESAKVKGSASTGGVKSIEAASKDNVAGVVKSGGKGGTKAVKRGAKSVAAKKTSSKAVQPGAAKPEPQSTAEEEEFIYVDVIEQKPRNASIGGMSDSGFDVMEVFAHVEKCEDGTEDMNMNVNMELDERSGIAEPGEVDVGYSTGGDQLVAGFMADDILSSNFDMMSTGVTVT